ncbi:ABC transporter permease [Bacillus manliponensis]|uniref:ABC transporter permease n=1 Tax=Bacillus manliponensis TaxID=574376 RepID=A0A073JTZ6_9BACI|nr:ABC transporter permease [Bacillus manliponensis]KEK17661.1 ABC transporter permease [Bacillus manliponensis]
MNFWQFALKNVTRNSRSYFAYFVSSAFSIATFFSFAVYLFHPKLQFQEESYSITSIMIFSEIILVFFAFFFLLYSIGTFLHVRKKQFGVLMVLGISKKQLKRLVFLENMLIGILSIFFGLQIGLVFSQFFLLVTAKITNTSGLYLYWPTEAIVLTTSIFLGLFIIVSMFTPSLIRTRKAVQLLKSGRSRNKERKPSIFISLFGVSCLISGYLLAANGTFFFAKGVEIWITYVFIGMFTVPVLVTIGTYIFFSQISFLLIRILKMRRKFYMKRVNMLWISDLASRIRTNINMLFIVAMLSTVAFTMITFIYGFGKFTKLTVMSDKPFPFTYISYDQNPLVDNHIAWLNNRLTEDGFSYEQITVDLYEANIQETEETPYMRDIYIISEDDYNKLATALQLKNISVQGNEAYILPGKGMWGDLPLYKPNEAITLVQNATSLQVKAFKSHNVIPSGIASNLFVLSNDFVAMLSPEMEHMKMYNFQVTDWEKTHRIAKEFSKKMYADREAYPLEERLFMFFEAGGTFYDTKQDAASTFLIGTFLGVVFFIGAGSVLYFRMYTDLTNEQEKYITVTKIGLTEKEMHRSATIQLAILFFVPYIMASIHTLFAAKMFQGVINLSLFTEVTAVLVIFGTIEILFFFLIRSLYIQKLSRHVKL